MKAIGVRRFGRMLPWKTLFPHVSILLILLLAGCAFIGPMPWVAEVTAADPRHPATANLSMVRTGDTSWSVSGTMYRTAEPKAETLHGLALLRTDDDGAYVTSMTASGAGTVLTCTMGEDASAFLAGTCLDQDRNGYSVRVRRF